MNILFLVAQCVPGDTINLTTMTIVHKSLISGIKRWLTSENRYQLLDNIENASCEFPTEVDMNLITIGDREKYVKYYYLIHRIISGLTSLILTYSNDEEIILRLRRLIAYFNEIKPPPPPPLCVNNIGYLLPPERKGLQSLL